MVRPGEIVVAVKNIPEGEKRDECVDPGPDEAPPERKLEVEVGQLVIARWSEDKVWYRAKVLEVLQGSLQVVFTDYGNEEKVEEKNIVLCGADIPQEDFVDWNVKDGGDVITCRVSEVNLPGEFYLQEKENDAQLEELLVRLEKEYSKNYEKLRLPGSEIMEGLLCVVIRPEDDRFYRAIILEAQDSHQLKLQYIDYGTLVLHSREKLYTLVPDLGLDKYPRMSQKARLHGVKRVNPFSWGRQASVTFHKLVVNRDVEVTTRVIRRGRDRWSVTLEVEEEESGEMVDVGEKLASLGLVLLEFKEVKPAAQKLDSNVQALEKLSSILHHRKVSLDPAVLEEISMEHQAISESDLTNQDTLSQVQQRQKVLSQKVLGHVLSGIIKQGIF